MKFKVNRSKVEQSKKLNNKLISRQKTCANKFKRKAK